MKMGRGFWFVLPIWLVPVITISVYLGFAPDVVTHKADTGSFVSAQVRPPGVFDSSTTSVQTTQGVLFVSGVFTAPTGEPLVLLRDSTQDGVQLCRRGSDDACAALVGRYVGDIPAVPGIHTWLTYPVRLNLEAVWMMWFLSGLAASVYTAFQGTEPRVERVGNA